MYVYVYVYAQIGPKPLSGVYFSELVVGLDRAGPKPPPLLHAPAEPVAHPHPHPECRSTSIRILCDQCPDFSDRILFGQCPDTV